MKKKYLIIFSIFLYILPVFSNIRIGLINFNFLLENSIKYQNFIKKLNIELSKEYTKNNIIINNLLKKENNLNKKSNLINKKIFYVLKKKINLKKKKILFIINNLENIIYKKNINLYNNFFLKIKNIINIIAKEKKLNLIINDNFIIYNNKDIIDITSDVIKKINYSN